MILTISNLYPFPGQPTRGLFNAQLFQAMAERTPVENLVPVAVTCPWAFRSVRQWHAPVPPPPATYYTPYMHLPFLTRNQSWRAVCRAINAAGKRRVTAPPSVILAAWLYPDGVGTAAAFRNSEIPVWILALGTDRFHLRHPRRHRALLEQDRYVAGYLCVAQNIADDLCAAGLNPARVHVVPNGVDTRRFLPVSQAYARTALGARFPSFPAGTATDTLVWIGNLVTVKAPRIALEAIARALRKRKKALTERRLHLIFIGDGPLRRPLKQLAVALDVAGCVTFAGRCPHDEIPLWLNGADGLLLSSNSEGMPNAVTEALACGCPVTATDTGACREMLAGQPCCHTVATRQPDALAAALEHMLQDRHETALRPVFTRTWHDMAGDILALTGTV